MKGIFGSDVDNTSAVTATGTNGANGVIATSDRGRAVRVESKTNTGVESTGHIGVRGVSYSTDGVGISGEFSGGASGGTGVRGVSYSTDGVGVSGEGITGVFGEGATGVKGQSRGGTGVSGYSYSSFGIGGFTPGRNGVYGSSDLGIGVSGEATTGTGVLGHSDSGTGLIGESGADGVGVFGKGGRLAGQFEGAVRVEGNVDVTQALTAAEVVCSLGNGISAVQGYGYGNAGGVTGVSDEWIGVWGRGGFFAGYFLGDVGVTGALSVTGALFKPGGGFKIDHPLDPENKYLYHSFVESPDMLNIYNGNSITDVNGDATIKLPDYFEALNEDFRYQLTVIGQFAQAIVAEEIRNNQFTIKTDQPNIKVSWQVTGVRKDAFANSRRIMTEADKPVDERGLYIHPEVHGKPETQGIRSLLEKQFRARGRQRAP